MNRTKGDEEEYWNSSKFKAFTFDDEDDELSQLKESKRAVNSLRDFVDDDDEDDLERVSWTGEPVGSISWSIKETAGNSGSSHEREQLKNRNSFSTYAQLPKPASTYSLSSFFRGRTRPGSFQSLSDALSDTPAKSYAPELGRPKGEYRDYSNDWSPSDTVRRLRKGKVCSLERFRSLQDKIQLLEEAVSMHDGNVITAVSCAFLLFNYCFQILFRELEVRQVALRHLIHFLKEIGDQKLLLDLFRFLDRTEELALSHYREHLNIQDPEKRKEFLKTCIGLPFSAEDSAHIQDHYTLLERQIIIEANDRHLELAGQTEVFRKHPRKASILNMPLVTTLFYSCFYHYTEAEGTFSSPVNLKKTFKIPDKQYVLTALAARAKLRAWHDVDALFTTKNWLGYTKKRAPIGFHRVVEILHKNSAPVQVLQEYVNLVEDVDTKLNLATKFKCHDVVIDTCRDLKDRQQLLAYRSKVDKGSAEEEKIDALLNSSGGLGTLADTDCSALIIVKLIRESFARKLVLEKRTSKCHLTGLREETQDDDALKVGIIGGGHLGKQLAHMLLQFIPIPAENLRISTRRPETLDEFKKLGIQCFYQNASLVGWANVVFLCCLPSQLPNICVEIQTRLGKDCIVYSFVSAIPVSRLKLLLNHTNILRPQYQCAEDLAHIWGANEITAALQDPVILQATCPYSPAGGISLNIKWLEGMFYALLNFCTAKDMPHPQVLQHLSELFSSQHLKACREDEASPLQFQAQDFVSQIYAKNLSQRR
ncbi:hypothetical protein E5288_WYG022005 [Bos mutus]|uniref:NADP-dependent oxidoreductase domain-containing protein 1 n=1 Tax=Bos mutus TaxID=72004 RepID=A0A6B0S455_9CETA|nr:hypothetical protein [Bos mutus]